MSKLNRWLGVAVAVQVGLVALVSIAREEPKMAASRRVFVDLIPEKVTKIEVTGNAGTAEAPKWQSVMLEKSGTTWGVSAAEGYPADSTKIDTFLTNVEKLKASGNVVSKASYHRKLEVADENYQRKVVLTQEPKPVSFYLGSSPSFKRIHLRATGSDDVVSVEGLTSWDVGYRSADWVDRNYVKIPEADVWSVTLKNAKGSMHLEKSPAGDWAMAQMKATDTLKKSAVDDLIRKVATITLEEPVGKTVKAEYGLDAPEVAISLVTGTSTIAGAPPKTTATQTIYVGKKTAEGNQYYVKASSSTYVVTAPGWAMDALVNKVATDLVEAPNAPSQGSESKVNEGTRKSKK